MLPKKERLSREAFNRFFSLGKRIHSPFLELIHAPHKELHVSVVIPKKVSKSAVERNVLRRRVYDIVRHYRTETGITGVYIFLVKPRSRDAAYETIKEEVRSLMHKAMQ